MRGRISGGKPSFKTITGKMSSMMKPTPNGSYKLKSQSANTSARKGESGRSLNASMKLIGLRFWPIGRQMKKYKRVNQLLPLEFLRSQGSRCTSTLEDRMLFQRLSMTCGPSYGG